MLLRAITGNESFPAQATKVNVFFIPTRRYPGTETMLSQMVKLGATGHGVAQQSVPSVTPAGLRLKPELVGRWFTTTFEVPDGMILKVFAWKSRNGLVTQGSMLIQARAAGGMNRITVQLCGDERATLQNATIEGRFDMLTVPAARTEGAVLNQMTLNSLDAVKAERVFSVLAMAPEMAARTVIRDTAVVNEQGKTVIVREAERKRALDL